ncbi:MAG: matrixin family metalloprotease [bacterium]|nr:matrixin family metalloprotease [bacterium]
MQTRRVVDILVLVTVLGSAGYLTFTHQDLVTQVAGQVEARFLPCRTPITYSLGAIDTRFGISKAILIADLKEAESIWEKPSGKDLFEYKSDGGNVVVNFVYDYRQRASDTMAASGIQIDRSQSSFDALKAQYDGRAARIASAKAALNAAVAAYESKQEAYNAEVAKWNRQGGAPPAAYDRLQAEKAALGADAQAIQSQESALNADIETLNAIGTSLNKLIAELNLNVDRYNQAGASTGGEFEEGEYVSEAGSQRIDIYEYSSHTELVRVLTHELGHALGLGHVVDGEAIMYKVNQGKKLSLTPDDITELNAVCASGLF